MSVQARSFRDIVESEFEKLDIYTKAIARAHGESHPEAFKVRDLFETIQAVVKAAGTNKPDLDGAFGKLREVTDNYTIPNDVCETYAAVCNLLAEADNAYHAQ